MPESELYLMHDELSKKRREAGGCYCDDLRSDGTCKSCGCLNIQVLVSDSSPARAFEAEYQTWLDNRSGSLRTPDAFIKVVAAYFFMKGFHKALENVISNEPAEEISCAVRGMAALREVRND